MGIESSCDETAIALIDNDKTIYCNEIYSQIDKHQIYGGVVPEIAARSHLEIIQNLTKISLEKNNFSLSDINAISVTSGPGLIGGLMIGVNFAQTLSHILDIPCYGINHLEGHALSIRLSHHVPFPYLTLLISGGHCQILAIKDINNYELYGQTLDDAAGETFDKIANLLGLPYPGGPAIEEIAKNYNQLVSLPTPLTQQANCNFSFSGLKSAIRRKILAENQLDNQKIANFAASLQQTIADIFCNRLKQAIIRFRQDFNIKKIPIAVVGGVARNQLIQKKLQNFCDDENAELFCPPMKLCTDNAAMIAWAGIERIQSEHTHMMKHTDMMIRPRWPLTDMVSI